MDPTEGHRSKRQRRAPANLADTDFQPSGCIEFGGKARPRPTLRPGGVLGGVFERELLSSRRRLPNADLRGALLRKLPAALEERPIALGHLLTFDKAFSCEWLNERSIALGTKDDKITVLDAATLLPRQVVALQPPIERRADTELPSQEQVISQNCGVRGLAVNPAKDLLAAGGCGPSDGAILSLPDCRVVQRLQGHGDWVFGAAWITDRLIATGSRDQTVKLWALETDVETGAHPTHTTPLCSSGRHKAKVRDIKWNDQRKELVTLSTGCALGLWDAQLGHIRDAKLPGELADWQQVKLPEAKSEELCCLAASDTLMAAGSVSHVHLVDPRARRSVAVQSLESHHGVRSLQFCHELLSVGTGRGSVLFYDVRAGKYLEEPVGKSATRGVSLALGPGWLKHNSTYRDYFAGNTVYNAAYGHAWDPGGTRLFVCGGPLATGLHGSYMAMWR